MTVSAQDVVGDSKNMTLGDTVLRISVKPEFVLNRNEWQPNTRSGQKGYLGGRGDGAEVGMYQEPVKKAVVKPKKKRVVKKDTQPTVTEETSQEVKTEPVKTEAPRVEAPKAEAPKTEASKPVEQKTETNAQ